MIIYRGGRAPVNTSTSSTSTKTTTTQTTATQTKSTTPSNASYIEYTVKSGDSLYLIAKKFPGVSAQNIMDFNKIGSNIKPGMKIKIPKL